MKTLLTCRILLVFLISCSTDSDLQIPQYNNKQVLSRDILLPENTANPMDYKGKLYYNALSLYQQQNEFPNSIGELNKQISFIGLRFEKSAKTSKGLIPFTDEIVESIMADPDQSLIAIIGTSTLTAGAKSSLIDFLQGLISYRQLEFSLSYDYIVTYENTIIQDSGWSQDDRDTVLTVTSIARYSLYSELERKDRDWESSAGNKFAKPFFSTNEIPVISIIALLGKIL